MLGMIVCLGTPLACGSQSDTNGSPGGGTPGSGGESSGNAGTGTSGTGEQPGVGDGAGDAGSAGETNVTGTAGAGSTGAAGSGGTGSVASTQCNELVVGDLPLKLGVVAEKAPVSTGGAALLAGTYDLARLDMYIPTDLSDEAASNCQSLAKTDAKKEGMRQSYRFTAASGGRFLLETVLDAPNAAAASRGFSTVSITSTTLLDPVDGTNQCLYTNVSGTEKLTQTVYERGPGFLGNDYLSSFTVTADSLRVVDGASFPQTGPAYCSRVYSFERR